MNVPFMSAPGRVAGLLVGCVAASLAGAAEPPPVTSFTHFAKYESVKIAPDGRHLALTRRTAENEGVIVLTLPELKMTAHTHFGRLIDIWSFDWANDSRLLIAPARRFPGFISFKAPTGEFIGMNSDGKGIELLFGPIAGKNQVGTAIKQRESVFAPATIVDDLPAERGDVLIQTHAYAIEGDYNSAYRMDVRSGRLRKLAGSPVRNGTFVTDSNHRVALVYGPDPVGNTLLFHRTPQDGEWQRILEAPPDAGMLVPVAATAQNGQFFALDNRDAETLGVFAWSPASGEQKLLYRHPDVDVALAGKDPSGRPWVFEYMDHFPGYWYPDPEHPLAQVHRWLRSRYPAEQVEIASQTDDMKQVVARVSGPRMPPTFLVIDATSRTVLQQLQSRPDLAREQLAEVEPIEFQARDGLKIRGYLTTPNGPRRKGLPLIVLVHGGPHGIYDGMDFDFESQLFASRGYAVLQVNFRGSGGRGRIFQGAGYGRWGREMQDDITDAVRWAIGDGVADRKRICIYGGSYGAYAALTGAFREPDLFRCAVGMAGVYDLPLMFEEGDIQSYQRGVNYLKRAVGTDMEELKRRSPVFNADRIRAAVLLLHGKIDERAPFEHARRMREALVRAGNPPEWYTEWGEAHGFFDEANREAAYEIILAFFAKHLH